MLSKLRWLTTLSLDAPLVAVSWQVLLFREFSSTLHWYYIVIVFLSVWLGYAADRWFDNLRPDMPTSQQHRFFARNSKYLLGIWLAAILAAVSISLFTLTRGEFLRGLCLMLGSLFYTLMAQKGRNLPYYPLLKSTFTGLLVLASSLLFLHPHIELALSFRVTVFTIWLLFTGNCLLIRSWTRHSEAQSERRAILSLLSVLLVSTALLLTQAAVLASATLLSAVLLLSTNRLAGKLPQNLPRTLADLCLLTPLVVLLLS